MCDSNSLGLCVVFRLSLPGRIVEDGREKAKFDIDKGTLLNDDNTHSGGKNSVTCHGSFMGMSRNKIPAEVFQQTHRQLFH